MTATHLGTYTPQTPEWHAARMTGLGGSEIAAVLGLSKYESRYALYHRKRGHIPPQPDNTDMEWGRRLEDAIRAKFAEEHPELVVDHQPGTWASLDRPWQIANPDGLAFESTGTARDKLVATELWRKRMPILPTAVVEIKTARDDWEWGRPGTDEIPPYYLAQARWYLDVFALDVCHLAVLIGGSDYREYLIRPDAEDTTLLREAGATFMADLAEHNVPDIDDHDATYQAVKQLPDGVIDGDVEIDPDLADAYLAAIPAAKQAAAEKQRLTSLVLAAIGDHTRAVCNGQRIATRAITSDGRTHSLRAARTRKEGTAA